MKYRFRALEGFWQSFYKLSREQKEAVRKVWEIFKVDPFDRRLRAHKIHRLSAHYNRTIYSVYAEYDLRIVFFLDGNTVWTVDVGTHDVYKR